MAVTCLIRSGNIHGFRLLTLALGRSLHGCILPDCEATAVPPINTIALLKCIGSEAN